jgi:hypothetical protein
MIPERLADRRRFEFMTQRPLYPVESFNGFGGNDVIQDKQQLKVPKFTETRGTFSMECGRQDVTSDFAMHERFSGLMLPLIKRSFPDFGPVFQRYARDPKSEAERAIS